MSDVQTKEELQGGVASSTMLQPKWKWNPNGHGYSIDVETPDLTNAISAIRELCLLRAGGDSSWQDFDVREARDSLKQRVSKKVRVLEIGCGDAHGLARAFVNDAAAVEITFVDPGSDFDAFPQSTSYRFVQGVFPQALLPTSDSPDRWGVHDEDCYDVVYSARCLHCNTPSGMVDALRLIRAVLNPTHGRFIVATTGLKSGFYQQKEALVAYFLARRHESFPGHITAEEFQKHWPKWSVGDVTLLAGLCELRQILRESGVGAVVHEQTYCMRNQDGNVDEMLVAVAARSEQVSRT